MFPWLPFCLFCVSSLSMWIFKTSHPVGAMAWPFVPWCTTSSPRPLTTTPWAPATAGTTLRWPSTLQSEYTHERHVHVLETCALTTSFWMSLSFYCTRASIKFFGGNHFRFCWDRPGKCEDHREKNNGRSPCRPSSPSGLEDTDIVTQPRLPWSEHMMKIKQLKPVIMVVFSVTYTFSHHSLISL